VDESTFFKSKINWQKRYSGHYNVLLYWHRQLISLRSRPALKNTSRNGIFVYVVDSLGYILLRRSEDEKEHVLCFFNLSEEKKTFKISAQSLSWIKILDSGDAAPEEIAAGENLYTNPSTVVIYCNK
jgi:maltooligosyltrehalose trehalohydrolase